MPIPAIVGILSTIFGTLGNANNQQQQQSNLSQDYIKENNQRLSSLADNGNNQTLGTGQGINPQQSGGNFMNKMNTVGSIVNGLQSLQGPPQQNIQSYQMPYLQRRR